MKISIEILTFGRDVAPFLHKQMLLWGYKILKSDPTRSIVVIWVKIFKTVKTIEIQLVKLTEVCGEVLSEKNAYKSAKTALLSSNVIDADHQNSCLFTNKGHFSSPLWVLIGVLAKFHR